MNTPRPSDPATIDRSSFEQVWLGFNKWVYARRSPQSISSMWQGMIKDFDLHRNGDLPRDIKEFIFRSNYFRGYGFVLRGNHKEGFGVRGAIYHARYLMVRALNLLRSKLWLMNLAGGGKTELTGHPAGARELSRLGLWNGYVDFCHRHGFIAAGLNSMKCYYMASVLEKELGPKENVNILEIGGGVGNLASILIDIAKVNQYFIVDLPEMILNSSMAIRALYPDLPVHFLYPEGEEAHNPLESGVYFCVPEMIGAITSESFDLAVNIDSFQEMTEPQVRTYLGLVQRAVKPGGIFVNLNRRKFLHAEQFDNNPLMYPYAAHNSIRVWETDPFMLKTLNLDGRCIDSWILRVEIVNK